MKFATNLQLSTLLLGLLLETLRAQDTCDANNEDFTGNCTSATEFCGSDGVCHPYSCENWYLYSPWNLPDIAGPLQCSPFMSNVVSVVYACQNFNEGPKLLFDQLCSAEISSTASTFHCQNFTVGTPSFEEYTSRYEALAPADCNESPDVSFPFFQY